MLTNFEIEISKQIKCKFFDLGKLNKTDTLESGPPLKKMMEVSGELLIRRRSKDLGAI